MANLIYFPGFLSMTSTVGPAMFRLCPKISTDSVELTESLTIFLMGFFRSPVLRKTLEGLNSKGGETFAVALIRMLGNPG